MPYKKTIIILADGARPDVIRDLYQNNKLPNIAKYLIDQGTFLDAVTVFPSTTGPAYLPYLTGCYPGTCNIPGIRWFDKDVYHKKGWSFKSFRSYCGIETFLMNKDFPQEIKTAYQIFKNPFSILNMIFRGIKSKNNLTRYSRIWYYYYAHMTDRWGLLDHVTKKKTLKALDLNPDFIYAVFPAIDEYAHRSHPKHERCIQAYLELDNHIGDIAKKLKERGELKETLMIIVSDHGLSKTDHHFDVGPYLEKEKKIKTFYYSQIFKRNFKAASMVSGNGMVHLYFKGQNGWKGRLTYEEMSSSNFLIDEFRMNPAVDLIACYGQDHIIHLINSRGHGCFKVNHENEVTYQWKHEDPLGIFATKGAHNEEKFDLDCSIDLTKNSHFPDVFNQLNQLFKSPRCGDLVLSAKSGYDFRIKYEVPLHKGSHGSLCPEHMKIPFISNHRFGNGNQIEFKNGRKTLRSVDVFPTVLNLMGKDIPDNIDGKVLE